jgi:hypothetical protein
MFTIEHEFDASIVTLIDEGGPVLRDDVSIAIFDDCVTIEQHDLRTNRLAKVTLSLDQLKDLRAALDLPEGSYRIVSRKSEE